MIDLVQRRFLASLAAGLALGLVGAGEASSRPGQGRPAIASGAPRGTARRITAACSRPRIALYSGPWSR